jgi:hypothetical protein
MYKIPILAREMYQLNGAKKEEIVSKKKNKATKKHIFVFFLNSVANVAKI